MRNDYITRQVRRCSRNLAIAGICAVPFAILMLVVGIAMFVGMFVPPTPVEPSELLAIQHAGQVRRGLVRLTSDARPIQTGITYKISQQEHCKIVLIPIENRYLIALIPEQHPGGVYRGHLEPLNERDDATFVRQITGGDEQTRSRLLPVKMWVRREGVTETISETGAAVWAMLVGVFCLALGLVPLWRAGSRIINPNRSPIMRRFKQWGDAENALASLNGEMAQGLARRLGKLQYTPSWLVNEMLFDVDIARVDDIVWLYKQVAPGVEGGVTAVVRLRTKQGFSVIGSNAKVEEMLTLFQERVPWAFIDWDEDLDVMWRKDRDGLIRLAEKRYQLYLSPFGLKQGDNGQSSPDERIQKPQDGVKPSEPPSPEDSRHE